MATNCPSSTAVIDLDPLILKAMNDTTTGGWHLQEIAGTVQSGKEQGDKAQERKLKKFPPFKAWLPKGRALSGEEKQLLAGPKSHATSLSEHVAQELGSRPHTLKSSRSRVCQLNPPT